MLNHMNHSRTAIARGHPVAIGGHSGKRARTNLALQYMCSWVSVVLEVLRAEFPSWSVLHTFAVLSPGCSGKSATGKDRLERFTKVFHLNFDNLKREVNLTLPYVNAARARPAADGLSNYGMMGHRQHLRQKD